MKNRFTLHFSFLFASVLLLSACGSKKTAMRGKPGDMVKPETSIAQKYGDIMGVDKAYIANGRLYAFIEQWMGTPYKFGGQDKDGVDCSGLVQLLEQQVYGVTIPRMTKLQVEAIKRKYEDELQEGDLVFFDFDGKKFSHVGVYLQNSYIVHASTRRGVMIVRLKDPSMYKYFSRCGSVVNTVSAAQPSGTSKGEY